MVGEMIPSTSARPSITNIVDKWYTNNVTFEISMFQ